MKLRTNAVDVWLFHKRDGEPKYLLLHTSQEKADKWFFGDRFWQIAGGFVEDGETLLVAAKRWLAEYGLNPTGIWAAEHVYSFYSTRRDDLELVPVVAPKSTVLSMSGCRGSIPSSAGSAPRSASSRLPSVG